MFYNILCLGGGFSSILWTYSGRKVGAGGAKRKKRGAAERRPSGEAGVDYLWSTEYMCSMRSRTLLAPGMRHSASGLAAESTASWPLARAGGRGKARPGVLTVGALPSVTSSLAPGQEKLR